MQPEAAAPFTPRWLERAGERVNPVLVKEVRSALRGKAFLIGFTVVLLLALAASVIALIIGAGEDGPLHGQGYLTAVLGVFALGANGLVPFAAMASMSAEHDEGALELLQLSGLSAGRVVLGKLGAAAIQAVLLSAAFLPFLSFAALLPGVDLVMLASSVGTALVTSVTFASFGVLVGASLRRRWQRVLGYVFLALALLFGAQLLAMLSFALMAAPRGTVVGFGSATFTLGACAFLAAFFCALATARLTHPEENRASPLRVVSTAGVAAAALVASLAAAPGELMGWLFVALGLAVPSAFVGLTEPTALPRAVLARAVRRPAASVFLAPWLPGGGRAVLLVGLHLALIAAAGLVGVLRLGAGAALPRVGAVLLVAAYVAVALLLPSGALARWMRWFWAAMLARISAVLLPVAGLLVPAFVGFLRGAGPSEAFEHAGNPAHLAIDLAQDGRLDDVGGLVFVALLLLVAIALNLPRVAGSLREVPRERARRAQAAPAAETALTEAASAPTQP